MHIFKWLLVSLALFATPAHAEEFSLKVWGGTWVFVMNASPACSGTCTVRSNSQGVIDGNRGNNCDFMIDGIEHEGWVVGGRLTRGEHRLWRTYAMVSIRIDVELDDGTLMTFTDYGRTQFAYDDIESRVAVAKNGFKGGSGQWKTAFMEGTWTWQWSSNGGRGR